MMGELRVITPTDRAHASTRAAVLQDLHTMVTILAKELMAVSLRLDALQADVQRLQGGDVPGRSANKD